MKLWITGVLLIFLTACNNQQSAKKSKLQTADIKYAKHFNIIAHVDYNELQILNPENGTVEQKYALVKRNENVQIPAGMQKIEVPLKAIVALSGTHIGMMEKLNLAKKITGISSKKYVANETVLARCATGKVLEFEDFGILNPERVLKTNAKIIIYSGFEGSAPPSEDKLLKLDISCLPNYDWKENHPLGKAEWIKVFGLLFDVEENANTYFAQVEKEYKQLKIDAQKLTVKPTVFSGMVFGDIWFMPAGESYGAKLFEDAGASYIAKNEKGTGSVAYSFEKTFTTNQQTQFWLNVEVATKSDLLKANQKYKFFEAYKSGNVFSYAYKMNYFWENSAIEPQHVLSDLIEILHSEKIDSTKLYFYRRLTE